MGLIQIISVAMLVICVNVDAVPGGPLSMNPLPPPVKKCAEETGFDTAELGKDKSAFPEVTPELLCFLKCVHEGLGIINEAGALDRDKIKPFIEDMPPEKGEELLDCVAKTTKIEKCEDMAGIVECMATMH